MMPCGFHKTLMHTHMCQAHRVFHLPGLLVLMLYIVLTSIVLIFSSHLLPCLSLLLAFVLVSYCYCNKWPQTQYLKTTQIYYVVFQRSEVLNGSHSVKIKLLTGLHFFWRLQKRICFLVFYVVQRPPSFHDLTAFLHLRSKQCWLSLSHIAFTLTLVTLALMPPSVFKDPCDYTGTTQIIREFPYLKVI